MGRYTGQTNPSWKRDKFVENSGAQATEVALLLRKLQSRYCKGVKVNCIGTSASLSQNAESRERIQKFAGDLFGANFELPITAKRKAHHLLSRKDHAAPFKPAEWETLHKILTIVRASASANEDQRWNEEIEKAGLHCRIEADKPLAAGLCDLLSGEASVQKASQLLSVNWFMEFRKLATDLFPGGSVEAASAALKGLVAVASFARENADAFPLVC